MINKFYTINMNIDDIPENIVNIFTPAEIMECLCTYFKEPLKAIELMQRKLIIKQEQKEKEIQLKKVIEEERKQKQEQYRDDNTVDGNNSDIVDDNSVNEQKSNNTDPKIVGTYENLLIKFNKEESSSRKEKIVEATTQKYENLLTKFNKEESSSNHVKTVEETTKKDEELHNKYDPNDGSYCSYESAFEEKNH